MANAETQMDKLLATGRVRSCRVVIPANTNAFFRFSVNRLAEGFRAGSVLGGVHYRFRSVQHAGAGAPAVCPDLFVMDDQTRDLSPAQFAAVVGAVNVQKRSPEANAAINTNPQYYVGSLAQLAAGMPDENGLSFDLLHLTAADGSVFVRLPCEVTVEVKATGNKVVMVTPKTALLKARLLVLSVLADVRGYNRVAIEHHENMLPVAGLTEALVAELEEVLENGENLPVGPAPLGLEDDLLEHGRGLQARTVTDAIAMLMWLCAKFVNNDRFEQGPKMVRVQRLCNMALRFLPRTVVRFHVLLERQYAEQHGGPAGKALMMASCREAEAAFDEITEEEKAVDYAGTRANQYFVDRASLYNNMACCVTEETDEHTVYQLANNVLEAVIMHFGNMAHELAPTDAVRAYKMLFHGFKSLGHMFLEWCKPDAYFVAIYAYGAALYAARVRNELADGAGSRVDSTSAERVEARIRKLEGRCRNFGASGMIWDRANLLQEVPLSPDGTWTWGAWRAWANGNDHDAVVRAGLLRALLGHLRPVVQLPDLAALAPPADGGAAESALRVEPPNLDTPDVDPETPDPLTALGHAAAPPDSFPADADAPSSLFPQLDMDY